MGCESRKARKRSRKRPDYDVVPRLTGTFYAALLFHKAQLSHNLPTHNSPPLTIFPLCQLDRDLPASSGELFEPHTSISTTSVIATSEANTNDSAEPRSTTPTEPVPPHLAAAMSEADTNGHVEPHGTTPTEPVPPHLAVVTPETDTSNCVSPHSKALTNLMSGLPRPPTEYVSPYTSISTPRATRQFSYAKHRQELEFKRQQEAYRSGRPYVPSSTHAPGDASLASASANFGIETPTVPSSAAVGPSTHGTAAAGPSNRPRVRLPPLNRPVFPGYSGGLGPRPDPYSAVAAAAAAANAASAANTATTANTHASGHSANMPYSKHFNGATQTNEWYRQLPSVEPAPIQDLSASGVQRLASDIVRDVMAIEDMTARGETPMQTILWPGELEYRRQTREQRAMERSAPVHEVKDAKRRKRDGDAKKETKGKGKDSASGKGKGKEPTDGKGKGRDDGKGSGAGGSGGAGGAGQGMAAAA